MAVSLHGLRFKIAAAAVVKAGVYGAVRVPGAASLVERLAERMAPAGRETTGSYRGLASGLLRQALPENPGAGLVYDPIAGLVPGTAEPAADVQDLARRAEQDPTAANLIAAAAAYRKPYVDDQQTAADLYELAFSENPGDLRAAEGVLTCGSRSHYDWPRIWSVLGELKPRRGPLRAGSGFWRAFDAVFTPAPSAEEVRAAAAQVHYQEHRLPRLHQLLLETLAARMQYLGRFTAGTRLRQAMAANRVHELSGIPLESATWHKHLLGGYAYIGDDAALLHTARKPSVVARTASVQRQLQKLAADAALWTGDAGPLREHARARQAETPAPGEEQMRQLVAGKRIAVVGPAAGDGLGELIDSYDAVVRTRHTPAGMPVDAGTRTDIAYYAGRDLLRDYDQIAAAADSGAFQLAVTRPFFVQAPSLQQQWPAWLRPARFEYGLYFRGAPQGLQRIIYDLLQFAPAEIAVFNADFYAGQALAVAGYRASYTAFGPFNQTNDVVAMHDLAHEFRWVQGVQDAGLITAHGAAAEVLGLSQTAYLQRLEAGPLGLGSGN
ncbi:hypothetical protein [Nesterenkonia alkaliphila]|uniref:Uncharacterized protein n=1 Tax=Nesterenkonia alkaliphila TaxID=1463631 RepID=A0A7K1UIC8_9MICC|nr:hypothetical protein [Nesterenkonia alkaliphila]MVT26217.1 hypothetical protein [Nesterenkonia alkaliphila]GFZ84526.1 hypothetical protein GCM10011359_11860 [Nesterenkonia alkaliphila]